MLLIVISLSINGVWTITEVQKVKSNGTFSSVFPKESEAIFTHNFHSFCWTSDNSTVHSWHLLSSDNIPHPLYADSSYIVTKLLRVRSN
ncbi:MAG: hypothetical protein ACM3H8_08380 [Sphingobacteriales bacterium]